MLGRLVADALNVAPIRYCLLLALRPLAVRRLPGLTLRPVACDESVLVIH